MKYNVDAIENGKRLRELRGQRSVQEVAGAVGVSVPLYYMYEKGERTPSDKVKVLLARYYKTTVQHLFFGV